MEITQALYQLGVREDTLTEAEKRHLDDKGYLPLGSLLSKDQIEALCSRHEDLVAEEGDKAGLEVHQEVGADRLSDLINKGTIYHVVITHPRLLAAIAHVLQADLKTLLPQQPRCTARLRITRDARRLGRVGDSWRLSGVQLALASRRLHTRKWGNPRRSRNPQERKKHKTAVRKSPRPSPRSNPSFRKSGGCRCLQLTYMARRHTQPNEQTTPRHARLLLPTPSAPAIRPTEISPQGDLGTT